VSVVRGETPSVKLRCGMSTGTFWTIEEGLSYSVFSSRLLGMHGNPIFVAFMANCELPMSFE
jgi:hypothetical protein